MTILESAPPSHSQPVAVRMLMWTISVGMSGLVLSASCTGSATAQQTLQTLTGTARGGNFGYAVAIVPDLNGDARADLVVGMPTDISAGFDAGKVQVLSGADKSVLFELTGTLGDHFGHSVCSLGDINGDGRGDFAVGAPFADALFSTNCGRVTIYAGNASGASVIATLTGQGGENFGWSIAYAGKVGATARILVGAPKALAGFSPGAGRAVLYTTNGVFIRERRGSQTDEHFGWSVGGNTDVNGDGTPDLIVGAPDWDLFTFPNQGRVEVLSGSNGSVLVSQSGGSLAPSFGFAVAGLADVNGDGRGDYVVGAPRFSTLDGVHRGAARVYSGNNAAVLQTKQGDSAGDHFGYSVASLGDTNGDGRTDWAVGAPDDATFVITTWWYGRAYGFSGANGAQLTVVIGSADKHHLGFAVAGGGDVNGDGRSDLIAGAPFASVNGQSSDVGAVKVVRGDATTPIHYVVGKARRVWLGYTVRGIGDVNGDSIPDYAVAAPLETSIDAATSATQLNAGVVRVLSGSNGALIRTHMGQANDRFGIGLAGLGDVNGDGVPDYAIGAPHDVAAGVSYVQVFSGLHGSVLRTFVGQTGEAFGTAVAGGSDMDGDGRPDIIVGANLFDGDRGRVVAFSGLTGAFLFAVQGVSQGSQFGRSVASIGDVNGDGRGDILVGAFLQAGVGRAYILSGTNGATLRTHQPDGGNVAWFGFACSRVGDVNLDGIADYIIGGPRENVGAIIEPGTVRIYSGATGASLMLKTGSAAHDHLGWSVSDLGDLDLDGRPDVLAGAYQAVMDFQVDIGPGYALAISSSAGATLLQVNGQATGDLFGYSVASVGDINSDGKPDAVIGAPTLKVLTAETGQTKLVSLTN